MNFAIEVLTVTFTQPFLYISLIVLYFQLRKQQKREKNRFKAHLRSFKQDLLYTLGMGVFLGVLGSIFSHVDHLGVAFIDLVLIWVVSFLAIFIHMRLVNVSVAIGALGILHSCSLWVRFPDYFYSVFPSVSYPSLLKIAAISYVFQGIIVMILGRRLSGPIYLESKRGKKIGAYEMNVWSILPFFLPVIPYALPGGSLTGAPFAFFPVMTTFYQVSRTHLPGEMAKRSGANLLICGLVLLLMMYTFPDRPIYLLLESTFCLFAQYIVSFLNARKDKKSRPIFTNQFGLCVLAIVPSSPAEELGIQAGELIAKVNGKETGSVAQFLEAINTQAALVKLEVIDKRGEKRYLKRPIYEGDPRNLGLLFLP